jgi:hypothetical protein
LAPVMRFMNFNEVLLCSVLVHQRGKPSAVKLSNHAERVSATTLGLDRKASWPPTPGVLAPREDQNSKAGAMIAPAGRPGPRTGYRQQRAWLQPAEANLAMPKSVL